MLISVSSLVPNAEDLLALEVEEVAGILLTYLNSASDDNGDSVVQHGLISQNNFFGALNRNPFIRSARLR